MTIEVDVPTREPRPMGNREKSIYVQGEATVFIQHEGTRRPADVVYVPAGHGLTLTPDDRSGW